MATGMSAGITINNSIDGFPPAHAVTGVTRRNTAARVVLRRVFDAALIASVLAVFMAGLAVAVFGLRLGPVLSGSMRPAFQPGDLAIMAPANVADTRVGDIISFYPPNEAQAVVHRIASLDTRPDGVWVTTKGDANNTPDPWGQVRLAGTATWRLVATVPLIGNVPVWTQSIRGWLLVGAGLLLGLWVVLALWSYIRSMRQEPRGRRTQS